MKAMKTILKSFLKYNPFDHICYHRYKRIMKRGEWQKHINGVYYHVGARFFPKITWITNRTTWEFNERIPPREKGGLIVVSNHKYLLDPFFVSMAFTGPHIYREIRWVSKLENFTTPIVKSIIFPFGTIPLSKERTLTDRTIREISYCLKRGLCVGMFPEGGRTKQGPIRPFKTGSARMVILNKVPYIPTALLGNRDLMKGKAHIRVGQPVYLQEGLNPNDRQVLEDISEDMHAQVVALYHKKPQPRGRYELGDLTYNTLPLRSITQFRPSLLTEHKTDAFVSTEEVKAPKIYSYHDNERKLF
ncbi:MAG: 1-acyl-sn-glycerol-3-phosphate acyltransferase [Candidatus Lokiarchaeota archaeon]|nr:1-acyl-sn-glycerol-3-phosphate acyltransferase [Candidatus Lokiarchaeota archaeon]